MSSLIIDDAQIYYHESGEGTPIIFLHNGGSYHGIWKHQIYHLEKNYKIFALDLLNFGESDYQEGKGSIQDQFSILKQFMEKKSIQKPILIDCCIGASLALYASKRLEIASLILFNICPGRELMRNPLAKFFFDSGKKNQTLSRINLTLMKSIMDSGLENARLPQLLYGREENPKEETYQH